MRCRIIASPAVAETIFSKIIRREIPADIVYEDAECLAFRDINPQAPVHILIIPKEDLEGLQAVAVLHEQLLGHLLQVAARLAEEQGITCRPASGISWPNN